MELPQHHPANYVKSWDQRTGCFCRPCSSCPWLALPWACVFRPHLLQAQSLPRECITNKLCLILIDLLICNSFLSQQEEPSFSYNKMTKYVGLGIPSARAALSIRNVMWTIHVILHNLIVRYLLKRNKEIILINLKYYPFKKIIA